ncbi:ATP-dependent zinc metalloprotease FtsH [Cellulosilyticum lentocellum]|uniref:ATP-dependent zinc metalloprotease FtsH n=1 Tax=Cellulosilyticum lentocellum (strain ATCC 49066 / DSM 5427 / NCIMB 11756 / RHM5) TaxID=642492 RepID=F2JR91_CELLD|nr:ATP-dependent zinc metalloprotease FtsH [Cellulosilyticum lentocellum]ADZ85072.1 ATP-dependent metalloprotease FtsH [Cellulosilyticum lentocellum DSM 5427]
MKKKFKGTYVYLILVVVLTLFVFYGTSRDLSDTSPKMSALDVMTAIENKEIKSIEQIISSGDDGKFIVTDKDGNKSTISVAQEAFSNYIYNLSPELRSSFKFTSSEPQTSLFFPIMQIVLIIGMFIFIMIFFVQQMQGGGGGGGRIMNFGKSKAKMTIDEKGNITFKNVAGLEEEKEEVAEIVDFLKNQNRYIQVGAKIPKGVLLVGPPGTGKTLLAKAVAGEAGVPFFSISGSDFVEMFVGVGASRVRDLFEQAKKNAPCIVFIDEIDAVGRKRGAGLGGGHDEREQTLNQLLVEMDGFGANEGVIVMAATNRADILDPALLRPGRFDRQIVVGRPDVKGRKDIIKIHAKGKPLNEDVDIETIAKITSGFTGADLANLMNEAALLTARHNKRAIDMEEVQKAFVKIGIGTEKKSYVITDEDKRITAYHEIGHAILHEILDKIEQVHSVSIIPTGFAAGYTMPVPKEDHRHMTKTRMLQEIISLLGGRAAEEIVIGDITTGASNDIERATNIARDMVTKYGMSSLGPIKFGDEQEEPFLGRDYNHQRNYSDALATEIDKQISEIVRECHDKAVALLKENMEVLHSASEVLIKKEKITGREFRKLMRGESVDIDKVDDINFFETEEELEADKQAMQQKENTESVSLAKADETENNL